MKKLFLLFMVVFVTIGLSGCDLISPTQVEELSEDYCRDNPTSEICQGDTVGDLTDSIILNVFNTILDEYNDEANETFCDDYFSVTNTDLLDSCRESRAGLIPENYIGYTVKEDGVVKLAALSTQDLYEITVISDDLLTEIVFTIGLVNVEGIMYINSWSYDVISFEPQDLTVPLDEARAFFQLFVEDYLDPAILSYDLCSIYFPDRVTECIEERDESFLLGFDIVFNDMVDQGEGVFEVQMSFSDLETAEPKIEFDMLSFTYDEDGFIVMKFLEDTQSDEWLSAAQALAVIQMFLDDYADPTITNTIFNDLYFDNTMDEGFFNDRDNSFNYGTVLGVTAVDEPTEEPFDFLVVTMTRTEDSVTETMLVKMRIRDYGGGRYYFDILFDDYNGVDYDELHQFMNDLVEDYQDQDLSDEYVCNLYYEGEEADRCLEYRQESFNEGVTIKLFDLYDVYDYFEVQFEYTDGVDIWYETIFAKFYYNVDNQLKVEFHELGFDEIDYYEATEFMQKYFDLYNDPYMGSHDVCSIFFEGYSYDECINRRQQEMNDGIILEGFNLYNDDYGYKVEFLYVDLYDNHFQKDLSAYFYYNEWGELKLELFEEFYLISYEEVLPFIEQLVWEFNEWGSFASDEICNTYFSGEAVNGCIEKRESLMMDNVVIGLSMLEMEYDHYRIEFSYSDEFGNSWYEMLNAYFYYDNDGFLKVDFQGEGHEEFPYEDAYNYVQAILYDFANPEIPNQDFCNMYFPWLDSENCVWDRAILYDQLEHIEVYLEYMNYDGQVFEAHIVFNNHYTGETWTQTEYLEFGWDEYGDIKMHMYDAPIYQFARFNDAWGIIQEFFWNYLDPNISFEEMNAWYFDYQMGYDFQEERMENFEFGREVFLNQINDPYQMDGQEFLEVVIDIYEQGTYVETTIIWMRILILENGSYMLEVKDEGHNDYEEIGFNEAMDFLTWFVEDYSNPDLGSYEVCSNYFDESEVPMCMVKRDGELLEGLRVELHMLEIQPDGYYAEFGFYNQFDEFLYSEYIQVFFYQGERGELKISFDNRAYQKEFPYEEAIMFVEQMFNDYLYGVIPSDAFCDFYGYVFPNCVEVRELVLYNMGYMYMTRLDHNYDNVFYLEFAYQLEAGGVPINIGLEVAFFHDEYGNVFIEVWNQGPDFYYAPFNEATEIYTEFIVDYLDPSIPVEDIIYMYFGGWADEPFMAQRAQDLVSITDVTNIQFSDPYGGDGQDWINVSFEVTRYGEIEFVEDNFRIVVYGPGMYQIEHEYFDPGVIDYAMAYDYLYQYTMDLVDYNLDTYDFCNIYYDEYLQDYCWAMRETVLSVGYQVYLVDFYWDDYAYMYRTTLSFYDSNTGMEEYVDYNVSFWYGNDGKLKLELFEIFDNYDPEFDQYYQYMQWFVQDFQDPNLSDDYVCNLYFEPEQYEGCINERQYQFNQASEFTLQNMYFYGDYYEVELMYFDGYNTWYEYSYVRFFYNNYGELKLELNDVGFNEINYDVANMFLEEFFNLYVDPTLSSHEVCSLFFEWGSYDECVMRREQEMMDGIQLDGFDLFTDGYGFSIDFSYVDSELNHFTKHMNAYFYYNEYGALRLELYEDFNLINYEVAFSHIQQVVGEFNNWDLLSQDVCELFFGSESVNGCVEKRDELMMNGIYIQLWMMDVEYDHYLVEFEYNDGFGNYWYETVHAYFYYDESNNLKVDFMGEGPEEFPYEDAYNYLNAMLGDFGNPEVPTADFCYWYFPYLDNANCLWDRAVIETQLEHVEVYLNYMNYDGYGFVAEIVFDNHYTGDMWFTTVYLEFGYDEYGNVFMNMYEAPVTQYLNYYDSYNVIQWFIWDYMNPNVTFEDMNAWYFDYQMNWDFQEDRDEAFNSGMNLVLTQINDPYGADGQEYLEVVIDVYDYGVYIETMIAWMRVLPLDSGYHLIDMQDDNQQEYFDIEFPEAEAFVNMFIYDYSNPDLGSYDVCNYYFSEEELPMCMVKRDAEMMEGIFVMLHMFEEQPEGFFAEFGYYTIAGEFIYSEYTQIFFYANERGELKIAFDSYNYQTVFPYDEAMMLVDNMLQEYMNYGIPTEDYCAWYGNVIPNCWDREQLLLNNGFMFMSNFYHLYDNVFYLEIAFQPGEFDPPQYIGIELEFYYDDYGNIIVNAWETGPTFYYATYVEAQDIYTQFIADYLNPAIPIQQLMDQYFGGWMDDQFMDQRAEDLISVSDVSNMVFEDVNNGNGIDWISVTFDFIRYGTMETTFENFRVIVYEPGVYQLEVEQFNPDIIEYPVAFDFFWMYVMDMQDDSIDTDAFCSYYHEDYMHEYCWAMREDILTWNYQVELADFYFDEYMGMYMATLVYYDPANPGMEEWINYSVNFWYNYDGDLKLDLYEFYPDWDPLYDEAYGLLMNYGSTLFDAGVLTDDFCNFYFNDDPKCAAMRDGIIIGGWDSFNVDDFYYVFERDGYAVYEAQITIYFVDGTFIRQRLDITPYYDEFGYLQIKVMIMNTEMSVPSDAVLLDVFSTEIVLTQFALDYGNPVIDDETFCALYFGGSYNCMPERQEFIDMGGSAVFDNMIEMDDYQGDIFYFTEFVFTMPDDTFIQDGPFRVWEYNESVFIEFVNDYYLPVDPLDINVADIGLATDMLFAYLAEYQNLFITDEEFCAVFLNHYDPTSNCVLGRTEFVEAGGYTIITGQVIEIEVVDGDNYFEVELRMFDPFYEPDGTFIDFTLTFYVYITMDGIAYIQIPLAPRN